jgi:hypothetical protein
VDLVDEVLPDASSHPIVCVLHLRDLLSFHESLGVPDDRRGDLLHWKHVVHLDEA